MKLKNLIADLVYRAQGYWATDCRSHYGRGKPIPSHWAPGGMIERLTPEERDVLKTAKPEDFEGLRLDYVRPDVFYRKQ